MSRAFWKHHDDVDNSLLLVGPEEEGAADRRVVDLNDRARNNAVYRFIVRELSMRTIQVSLMTLPPPAFAGERITLPQRKATQIYCVVSGRAVLRIGNQPRAPKGTPNTKQFSLTSGTLFRTRHDTEATLAVTDENTPLRMFVITAPGVLDRNYNTVADDEPLTDTSFDGYMDWEEEDDEENYQLRVQPLSFEEASPYASLPFLTHPQANLRDKFLEVIYTTLDSPTAAGQYPLQEHADNDMIVFVAKGVGRFRLSGSLVPLAVSAGSAFLVPRNQRLSYDSNQRCSIFRFWFRKQLPQ